MLQHLVRRPGRPDAGPRQHRPGLPVVRQGHPRRHPARDRELRACCAGCGARTSSTGRASSARRCRASPRRPRPLDGVAAVRLARLDPQPRDRRAGRVLRRRLLRQPHLLAQGAHRSGWSTSTAERFEHYGHGTRRPGDRRPRRPGVHAQEQPGRGQASSGPYFDNAPVYGHGPSLEDFTAQTPLTVGSPQQVIERTLGFREYVGDYQRQLFLIDHAGLPLKTVLEQLDMLGEEVVPVLRKEFAALQPGARARTRRPTPRLAGRGGAATRRTAGRRRAVAEVSRRRRARSWSSAPG